MDRKSGRAMKPGKMKAESKKKQNRPTAKPSRPKPPDIPTPKVRSRADAFYIEFALIRRDRIDAGLKPYPLLENTSLKGVFDWCETIRDLAAESTTAHNNVYITVDSLLLTAKVRKDFGILEEQRTAVLEAISLIYHEEINATRIARLEWDKAHPIKKRIIIPLEPQKHIYPDFGEERRDSPSLTLSAEPLPIIHKGRLQEMKNVDGITVVSKGKRVEIFNLPITHIMRWMGGEGWEEKHARQAFTKLALPVSDSTLRVQMRSGMNGEKGSHGPPPKLTSQQESLLEKLIEKKVKPEPKKPTKRK